MTDSELDTALTDAYAEGRKDQLEEMVDERVDLNIAFMSGYHKGKSESVAAALAQPATQEQEPQLESDEPDGPTPMMLEAHKKIAAWIRASPVQPVLAQPSQQASDLDALRADAARYRWLRNEAYECVVPHGNTVLGKRTGWITKIHPGISYDAAIDAAIKETT